MNDRDILDLVHYLVGDEPRNMENGGARDVRRYATRQRRSGDARMRSLRWIGSDPDVMSGQPCIRGTRIPVSIIVGSFRIGKSVQEIVAIYNRADLDTECIEGVLRDAINAGLWNGGRKKIRGGPKI